MSEGWDAWRDRLAAQLESLAAFEVIVTSGPVRTRDRGTGWFGRPRSPEVLLDPFVQFMLVEDDFLVESVEAYPSGDREPGEEQRRALSAAGWLMPGDDDYKPVGGPLLRVHVHRSEATRAAELAVRTYRVLGIDDPRAIVHQRGP